MLSGLALGWPTDVMWTTETASGAAVLNDTTWSAAIPLSPGPNNVHLTAVRLDETAAGSVTIQYNPAFEFGGPPVATPQLLFQDEPASVRITISMWKNNVFNPETVRLWRAGAPEPVAVMTDGGGDCDELADDDIYTACLPPAACETDSRFSVTAEVTVGDDTSTVRSAQAVVECNARVKPGDCKEALALLTEARSKWQAAGGTDDYLQSQTAAVGWLSIQPEVQPPAWPAAGAGYGVSVSFKSGLIGALPLSPAGLRGGVGSRRTLLADPHGDAPEIGSLSDSISGLMCPPFDAIGPLGAQEMSLSPLRSQHDYGLIALAAHGDAYRFGLFPEPGTETLWVNVPVDCDGLDDPTQADLQRRRLVLSPSGYGITPAFVAHWAASNYPQSLVYLGACRSLYTGAMAAEYLAAGAAAVIGFNDYVSDEIAHDAGKTIFSALIQAGEPVVGTAADVVSQGAKDAGFGVLGDGSLIPAISGLTNPTFETGVLGGWQHSASVRVVHRVGSSVAPQGDYMALVGAGPTGGTLSQVVCVPPGATTLSFWLGHHCDEVLGGGFTIELGGATVFDAACDAGAAPQPVSVDISAVPAGPTTLVLAFSGTGTGGALVDAISLQ